ncbi:MAG TPA: NAD-glutamate dehydrogenase [Rhizomicrobium sp.]|jgi:glutamate dehydrogenase|nr:NAD-glutamate dehydrogenase [Rhizomicrobium sp.]
MTVMTAIRSAETEAAREAEKRVREARALLPSEGGLAAFFDALYASAVPDDVLRARPDQLTQLAMALHAEAGKRAMGEIHVAALELGHETVLVCINDDRPFLFDSTLAAAMEGGARIRAAFHPIMDMDGVRTSIIALVCDLLGEEARARLVDSLRETFAQGQLAVRDWTRMLARLKAARDDLERHPPKMDITEDLAFLDWLADNHFTFLGARDYVLGRDGAHGVLEPVKGSGLGVLSDDETRVIHGGRSGERGGLTAEVRAFLDTPDPLIVTKSAARSLVHRRAHMDYIGIKTFDPHGVFVGERRFVGLFTSNAYSAQPRTIPLLRRKIEAVMAHAGLSPISHDGKALIHILDTFPRDELFQVSADELYEISTGILHMGGLPRLKLFLRFDRFDRFVSALLLAPRDHINARLSTEIHALLAKAFNGRTSAFDTAVDDSALVRLHYIIGRNDGPLPRADVRELERQIAHLVTTWDDGLADAMCASLGRSEGFAKLTALAPHFSPGYRDNFPAHDGARDLGVLDDLAASKDGLGLRAHVWRKEGEAAPALRLKLYVLGDILPLSASLPVFENLGLKVIAEDSYPVSFNSDGGWRQDAAILDFAMERADGLPVRLDDIREPLEDAFHAVLRGDAESDGFNRLVMGAGLSWRDITILRATAKFLRQAAITFSGAYMQQALVRNPDVAGLLVALFHAKNDPQAAGDRAATVREIEKRIEAALKDVPSLDDDRIIRRFKNVIDATLRTNFFQTGADGAARPAMAMKFDSAKLDELPAPRPWREIFVYAPSVEGVHLRFGRIARGGLRWSDRREDFRTEILGLVKAQQVKNAVIVPVGAKGGFFPKLMPVGPTREQFMETGIAAYKTFVNALLDVTDNLDQHGQIVPPSEVLRPDGDDPYLVVAADKGTATFSDIANSIALERGFWLGDAFASGGSVGYDHKKMGITARGAWEAVKRHFRELGTDIQSTDFTVVGVGDMSGDVFGNGMLLSRHIRLVAAFDHRHIFLDPNADAATGFAERERLFNLPRSSWDDYNRALIGPGGGVFARTLKEIALSPEVKALIGSDADSLSPPVLINALLKAGTDLLWFGGIGTYIKAASQSNLEAGDRANDAVRINGGEVRAKVVGEGANLGVTQLGRIEYARQGGRIDTDAVDNSAGVDTSDHEVNLKILLGGPVMRGELSEDRRNALLASMTDDVAVHVLADNYNQTLALSVAQMRGLRDLDAHARMIRDLEARGKLDRMVEFLPTDAQLKALAKDGKGLTRPELCVLLAYAKLDLDAEVLASRLPDDPTFTALLTGYFPPAAVAAFPQEPERHRLRREIISTVLINAIINLAGPVFVLRTREVSGLDGAQVARGFVLSDGAFGLSALKTRIDALDLKVEAGVQTRLYGDIADQFRRAARWFLAHVPLDAPIADTVGQYRAGVEALRQGYSLTADDNARIAEVVKAGVPEDLARDMTLLSPLAMGLDVALLAHDAGKDTDKVAPLYFALGATLGLDRLRKMAGRYQPPEHWDRLALRRLLDDLSQSQRGIARKLLASGAGVEEWALAQGDALARTRNFLGTLEASGEISVAKLMLASSQIQGLN